MNQLQKEAINKLRTIGHSYNKIANLLGISENTIKSYCRRNKLGGVFTQISESIEFLYCRNCGAPLTHMPQKKQKQYCSDKCRLSWWNAHPEHLQHKNVRRFSCKTCGAEFESYGKRERKYCSRACYGKSKEVQHE